jgi:hypothetical protein
MVAVSQQATSTTLTVEKCQSTKMCCSQGVQEMDIFCNHSRSSLLSAPSSVPTGKSGLALLQKRSKALVFSASAGVLSSVICPNQMLVVSQQAASAELTVEKMSNHKNVLFTRCPRTGYFVNHRRSSLLSAPSSIPTGNSDLRYYRKGVRRSF